jgi:uncharacterized phage protein gp47/JayE
MPWATPTLRDVRGFVRDAIRASLVGSDANVPNSVLRVTSDAQGALCHLTLQYIDWLADQLLPDTAEQEWLDRHGNIWLVNADGTTGRKMANLATGSVNMMGAPLTPVPASTQMMGPNGIIFETLTEGAINDDGSATGFGARAVDAGMAGNLDPGIGLQLVASSLPITSITVVEMDGGTDQETDEELRARVLQRIRKPPMGGDADDYVAWAEAVPGVTRAWCGAREMGMGTVTVRFMMDDLRADNGGFPTAYDIQQVTAYLDTVRPVAVKDRFVVSPIPQPIDFFIENLQPDSETLHGLIQDSINEMLINYSAPGQTIFAAWKYYAVMSTPGVISFDLRYPTDDVMQSPGHLATLGDMFFDNIVSP